MSDPIPDRIAQKFQPSPDVQVFSVNSRDCNTPYNEKLRKLVRRCEQALEIKGHLGRVSAIAVRDMEYAAYKSLDGVYPLAAEHLQECAVCRKRRNKLINIWQQLAKWLQTREVPTKRAVPNSEFREMVSDHQYRRLKEQVEKTVRRLENDEFDSEMLAQMFSPNSRKR